MSLEAQPGDWWFVGLPGRNLSLDHLSPEELLRTELYELCKRDNVHEEPLSELGGITMRVNRKVAALTLVEVLIVAAIAVALAGIVFAVGRAAIASGKERTCAQNLRSLHQATALYAGDNGGYLPPQPWANIVLQAPYQGVIAEDVRGYKAALAGYGAIEDVWHCPSFPWKGTPPPEVRFTSDFDKTLTSYTQFFELEGKGRSTPQGTRIPLDDPSNPEKMALYLDLAWSPGREMPFQSGHGAKFQAVLTDGSVRMRPSGASIGD
jgi:type II secretory pathway pseudopilin PulG